MTNAARNFQSADEMRQNAAAVRNRLMNPANARREPPVLKIVHNLVDRPAWMKSHVAFDDHVKTWTSYLSRARLAPYKDYLRRRCKELGVDFLQVVGPSRDRSLTGPRQLLMWELKEKFGASYPRIGREFGGRDHSTVLHAIRRVGAIKGQPTPEYVSSEQKLLTNPDLKNEVKADYSRGVPIETISDRYDLSVKAINSAAKIENWKRPSRRDDGFKTLPVKVNLALLREEFESGKFTCLQMEDRHDLSDRTIRRIATKHGWVRRKKA
jgi:hypothetical protein